MWNLCVASLVVCFLDSTYGQVDIRKPPTITKHPVASIVYRSDDSVTLECKAEGIPAVSYEWTKNGLNVNPNQPNIRRYSHGTITMQPATSADEGYYQCFARNQHGTALSNTAHIQRAVLNSTSGTSAVLQKSVEEGKPFHIQANPSRSFPKPTYGWETAADGVDKSPVPFRPSRRIQIAENGDLYFAYALPGDDLDGKLYKCTIYNPYLDIKTAGSYTRLIETKITDPAGVSLFAPTLGFASATPTVAIIGGSVTLRCFFYGNPEPAIAWSRPMNTLPIGRHILEKFHTQLTINNVRATDEGDYVCTASNIEGRNTSTFQIRVEAVPRFLTVKDGPRDVNVTEGESYSFRCNAEAKPKATIVWFQDGQPLDPDKPPMRFVFSNDLKSLTIRDVCRDCVDRERQTDLMVIQCNASNIHGYAFASGYLNVLSRTTIAMHNETDVEVYSDKEGRVEFDCLATSDPSTPPTYMWFKVEAEGDRLLYNEPTYLTVNRGQLTIHVTANAVDTWPKYLGQYRCVVDTGHSRVNRTATVSPMTMPITIFRTSPTSVTAAVVAEYTWIWICIGVVSIISILVCIFCAVSRRKRDRKAKHSNTVSEAKGRPDAPGTELSYALYDTIADDQYTSLQSAPNTPTPFPHSELLTTSAEQGGGGNSRLSRGQQPTLGSVSAKVGNPSTASDAATQTESPEVECRCEQSGIAPIGQQSKGNYMSLKDRNLSTSSTYVALQLS